MRSDIPVHLEVRAPEPPKVALGLEPRTLLFEYQEGDPDPQPKEVRARGTIGDVRSAIDWIPNPKHSGASIWVSVSPQGLPPRDAPYRGPILVTSGNADVPPEEIDVELKIRSKPVEKKPPPTPQPHCATEPWRSATSGEAEWVGNLPTGSTLTLSIEEASTGGHFAR